MRKKVLLLSAVMAALILMIVGPVSKQVFAPRPVEAAAPALTVIVACKATPEVTRVKNNRSRTITIKSVGSIYRPFSYEPIRVDSRLGGGRTIAFESGRGADQNVLTGAFIYNNDVGTQEGARVTTSTGARFIDRCG